MTIQIHPAHDHDHDGERVCMSRRNFLLAGGALVTLAAIPGVAMATVRALQATYHEFKVAELNKLKVGEPIAFNYPYDDVRNIIVKLGVPAGGGIGPDNDIVAFNQQCPHQGGPLDGTYKKQHQMLGPCPLHLTTFDLTRHGMIVSGHATESLPQIVLAIRGNDIYAIGVMGLVFGYSANLAGRNE